MNKTALYEIDFINSKIILTKKFYKAAGTLNSNEYRILVQLRRDNPTFTVELREIKKKEGKQAYRNLTYVSHGPNTDPERKTFARLRKVTS